MEQQLKKILNSFSSQLQNLLRNNLVGIYLTGSIALNGYHSSKSDIDFTVVLDKSLSMELLSKIDGIHRNMKQQFPKAIMEGQYITVDVLGKLPNQIPPVVTYYRGNIENSYEGINAVTWFTLKKHGFTVWGKPANELDFDLSEKLLLQYVIDNVNTYWKGWLSASRKLFSIKGAYTMTKPSVEWGVLGISRMYYTLKEHDVISKENAGKYVLEHVPERFYDILYAAISIRTNQILKKKVPAIKRRKLMLDFIEYLINECNNLAI